MVWIGRTKGLNIKVREQEVGSNIHQPRFIRRVPDQSIAVSSFFTFLT